MGRRKDRMKRERRWWAKRGKWSSRRESEQTHEDDTWCAHDKHTTWATHVRVIQWENATCGVWWSQNRRSTPVNNGTSQRTSVWVPDIRSWNVPTSCRMRIPWWYWTAFTLQKNNSRIPTMNFWQPLHNGKLTNTSNNVHKTLFWLANFSSHMPWIHLGSNFTCFLGTLAGTVSPNSTTVPPDSQPHNVFSGFGPCAWTTHRT